MHGDGSLETLDSLMLDSPGGADSWTPVIVIEAPHPLRIVETSLTGLWRVGEDRLELAAVPQAVLDAVAGLPAADTLPESVEGGSMPLHAILHELRHHVSPRAPGAAPHVIALSHAPLTPADLELLDRCLGRGPVAMTVPGYGCCRIAATAFRDVWRVRYYNRDDTLLVDSLELGDVPQAIRATDEDLAETRAQRADHPEFAPS